MNQLGYGMTEKCGLGKISPLGGRITILDLPHTTNDVIHTRFGIARK
jgi:hypothetical protein